MIQDVILDALLVANLAAWWLISRQSRRTSQQNIRTADLIARTSEFNGELLAGLLELFPTPTPDAVTAHAAHAVLHMVDNPGAYIPPGDFYERLIRAMLAADPANFRLLWRAFPEYGAAVWLWNKGGPDDGPDTLRAVADSMGRVRT